MAGITGLGLTFNLPNFVGRLYNVSPEDTRFLSAIGGLRGGKPTLSVYFQWQEYDLRTPAVRVHVEGADTPEAEERVRSNVFNVVQIAFESVNLSYTKLAAVAQLAAVGGAHPHGDGLLGTQPVQNEVQWQVDQALKQIARDLNHSFINGVFNDPVDNTGARQTRGLLQAIATNHVLLDGDGMGAPDTLTKAHILEAMERAWLNGGLQETETRTMLVNSQQKQAVTDIFITDANYRQNSRTVGGVAVDSILTDFGELSVMLERMMPQDEIAIVSMEECQPVHLLIPGKGFLFVEPVGKTGAREELQMYGEVGLEYGNERKHAKITNIVESAPV